MGARSTAEREQAQRRRQHIVVIGSAADLLHRFRWLLQRHDYNVTITTFVPPTFDAIAAVQPALLILEVAPGAQAGWGLLEQLHGAARTRAIPVVVLATDTSALARLEADPARDGGDAVLAAPVTDDDLLATVRDLIGPA